MNRVKILCTMDEVLMQDFSQRTVEGLRSYTLFRLALPPFQAFLDINVAKEIEKDRSVIQQAASLQQDSTPPQAGHISKLLESAREIDQRFVQKTAVFPINIQIQYRDIEHYRRQRYQQLLELSYQILDSWQDSASFRAAVANIYSKSQFHSLLHEILRLYAMETQMLNRSISLPRLLLPARDRLGQTIADIMEQQASLLAFRFTNLIYQQDTVR